MKLLIVSGAFPPLKAGESDHMLHLSRKLTERGVEVHVLTTRGNGGAGDLAGHVHPVMRNWSWFDLPLLARFLKRCRPDGILLKYSGWIYNYHPMITFLPTLAKALLPGVPFVTQFGIPDGSLPDEKSVFVRALRKTATLMAGNERVDYSLGTLLRDSDRIIALADLHRKTLVERSAAAEEKTVVIPPPPIMHICPDDDGAARRRGREILAIRPDDFVIVYFGYIYPGKGIETLVRAFGSVKKRNGTNLRLVLVGGRANSRESSSYVPELETLCRDLGVEDSVLWKEYSQDSDEGSLFLRAADLCVLPFDDGVMLNRSSLAAAATHGLPVITTRREGLESAFRNGENLFLCPPKDPEALSAAIELLMNNAELRRRLSRGARDMAREWFSWEKAVDRTLEAFGARGEPEGASAALSAPALAARRGGTDS